MKDKLQDALSKITVLVHNATKARLGTIQLDELRNAIAFLHDHWPPGDGLKDRATWLRDSVCASGIISTPQRQPVHTQHILRDCEALLKYIDEKPRDWL